jgi:asparagine synthase (glutamine-hydrolysing)
MCGIAGFIDPRITNKDRQKEQITSMLKSMEHRGPDYSGDWQHGPLVLGHNRLSIIDLSEASHQPFHYQDVSISFNGEVYNYLELKETLLKAGFSFSTSSDTEVICAAYKYWGEDCVQHFMGMWAFAIWDEKEQKLFCSRDRFGIKPFYFQNAGEQFYFASEYRALKLSPLHREEYNENHLLRYLQLGWLTYNEESFYSGISALPEAHNLIYQNGKIRLQRYWDLSLKQNNVSAAEAKEEFKSLFMDSVNLHMRADTPVGACLSGGLDSSAICSSIGQLYPKLDLNTFTIYYGGKDEVDERPWAHMVHRDYPSLKAHDYYPQGDELLEQFENFFDHFEVPPAGSSPLSQYFVMKLAKSQGMKVLLDGQGADEFLAGYDHSFYRLAAGKLKKGQIGGFISELEAFQKLRPRSMGAHLGTYAKSLVAAVSSEEQMYGLEYRKYHPFVGKEAAHAPTLWQPEGGSRLNQFLYQLTMRSSLPSLLHNEDRNSMAFSIESRVPFLDHRLVEYSFNLPDELKLQQGWSKKVLREAMRGIMPPEIIDRKDKKGFVTPGESKWLRGGMKHLVDDLLARPLYFLDEAAVKKVVQEYQAGDNRHARLVWRLSMLRKWIA